MNTVRLTTLVVPPRIQQGDQLMSKHVTISPAEAADRLAIRELVEAYAHCADRRDAKGQMSIFTEDTYFVVYMHANDPKPSQEPHSREALAPVFADRKGLVLQRGLPKRRQAPQTRGDLPRARS
jgi:hypothetical protein